MRSASEGRFPVACSQLAGNALGRIVPGSATPFTVVLRKAGFDGGDAAAALTASTGLQIATALAMPVLAVPAILGGAPIDRGLTTAAYIGVAVVVLLIGAGAVLFTTDAPLRWVGRSIQALLNATVRRRRHLDGLPEELISDRDFIRKTLGRRWRAAVLAAVGNTGFDYLALLCALRAVGAAPRPSLVMLAYASAELLAQIPFTPGGLGFVEAGLVGTLTLAGGPGPGGARRDPPVPTRLVLAPDPGRWGRVPVVPTPVRRATIRSVTGLPGDQSSGAYPAFASIRRRSTAIC